eukprot:TRINITY_DN12024_c0_g2_i1.p6 TRINITY_DN12024_c0_g2~~TRINITY_DN12024_c0_g2_i1.p6  ORF type:complete len:117 (-),score=0.28 TRINITY_DN12024_c0_g2_i1:746-1096(-)
MLYNNIHLLHIFLPKNLIFQSLLFERVEISSTRQMGQQLFSIMRSNAANQRFLEQQQAKNFNIQYSLCFVLFLVLNNLGVHKKFKFIGNNQGCGILIKDQLKKEINFIFFFFTVEQ